MQKLFAIYNITSKRIYCSACGTRFWYCKNGENVCPNFYAYTPKNKISAQEQNVIVLCKSKYVTENNEIDEIE